MLLRHVIWIALLAGCLTQPFSCDPAVDSHGQSCGPPRAGEPCPQYNQSCTGGDGVACYCGSDLTWYCGMWQDLKGHYDLSTPDLTEPPDLAARD